VTTLIHTKIAKTIAAAVLIVVVAAVAAPAASAGPSKGTRITIPPSLTNFHEPGSTGCVPKTTRVTIPSWLANFHEPGSTGYLKATIPARLAHTGTSPKPTVLVNNIQSKGPVGGGFDWVSALIGAGGGLGIAVAGAGGLMALRKRRTLAHV
jgi:hypothetical protein